MTRVEVRGTDAEAGSFIYASVDWPDGVALAQETIVVFEMSGIYWRGRIRAVEVNFTSGQPNTIVHVGEVEHVER